MKQRRFRSFRPCLDELEPRLTMTGPGANSPVVLSPQSQPFGASYGEWAARWWQWAFRQPVANHPLAQTGPVDLSQGQSGDVWFLGWVLSGSGPVASTADRTGTIPAGKALFFPLINSVDDNVVSDPGLTPDELRATVSADMDSGIAVAADVDGLPIQGLTTQPQAFREQSPAFSVTVPGDNLFGLFGSPVPAGTYSSLADSGYYLMLAPLPTGAHTIHFHAELPSFGLALDITYHLTVVGDQGAVGADHAGQPLPAVLASAAVLPPPGAALAVTPLPQPTSAQTQAATAPDQIFAGPVTVQATAVGTSLPASSPQGLTAPPTPLDPVFAQPLDRALASTL
jgi:hypothetical protein